MTAAPQPAAAQPAAVQPAPARQAGTVAWTSTTYFAEGLPWSVLHQIASEFLTAAGLPPSQVGYTSALHLTSTLKFLWSPVVDLYGSFREWIFATQAVLGALMGLLAVLAHDLAQSSGQDTSLIWLTLIAIGVASATHDIACDGYYMDALPRADQARYAGVRVAAFRVAMLVGNSGLVYLGGRYSWLLGFGVAAALMLGMAVGHRLLLPRGANERARASVHQARSGAERMAHVREAYLSFLRQDRALLVVLFLLTYKLGDALMFNMSKVMLRDLGVSTAERGVINGFGTVASIVGAMIGGAWIARTSLSRAIIPITVLMTATQPLYLIIAAPSVPMSVGQLADAPAFFLAGLAPSLTTIGVILAIEQICGGMAVAAQMVFLMRRCHPDHKAAHFAFGTAIYALSQMVTGAYSGWVYEAQGPLVYFALACVACIPCLLLVGMVSDSETRNAIAEARTEGEARFEAARRRIGKVLAPLGFFALLLAPLSGLTPQAHALAAITVLTVILWITEAVPLAVAALLAPALAVVLGVTTATDALAPLASPLIFLFMGGFMLALGLAEQGLDRRAALWLLGRGWISGSPARASAAIAVVAFVVSMWISNTATTAMLIPVALGLCSTIRAAAPEAERHRFDRHAEGMLLSLTYAASLGGIATPVGTAPNVIALDALERQLHLRIDFFQWMSFALPTALLALGVVLVYARFRFPAPVARLHALADNVEVELQRLGPMSSGERRAAAVFLLAVCGWLTPALIKLSLGPGHPWTEWSNRGLDEGIVALLCGLLLCLMPSGKGDGKPVLAWERAVQLDWSTLLLLGGGLSLGKLMFETGLAKAVADGALAAVGPLAQSPFGLLVFSTALVLALTEITSNVATTSMMVPVLLAIALAGGNDPVPTVLCVTMAASFAFMLPVSTPPNAIAYGTGKIRIGTMLRFGVVLDIAGLIIIVACGALLLPLLRFG